MSLLQQQSSSAVSSEVVEQWILLSAHPQTPALQLQATSDLQRFLSSYDDNVVSTLLTLLSSSNHEAVVFYALSELSRRLHNNNNSCSDHEKEKRRRRRRLLNPQEQAQLLSFLLSSTPNKNGNNPPASRLSPSYLRNKAALVLATLILQQQGRGRGDGVWESYEDDLVGVLASTNAPLFLKTVETLYDLLLNTDTDAKNNCADAASGATIRHMRGVVKGGGVMSERFCERILVILTATSSASAGAVGITVATNDAVVVLALKAIKSIFLVDLASLSVHTINRLLEYLLVEALHPSRVASVQLSALEVWGEWIHSSMACAAVTTTTASATANNTTSTGRVLDGGEGESVLLVLEMDDRHLGILGAVLEKLHEYNLLPVSGESTAEIEVVIEIAKLVCNMGLHVLPVWLEQQQKCQQQPNASALQARWNQILDLFFRAFAYDDIDVSSAVLPFAASLVKTMGGRGDRGGDDVNDDCGTKHHVPHMLSILYQQLKYPPDYDRDNNDDDAEEQIYRVELCKLYAKLVRVQSSMCLQFVCEASSQWLSSDATTTSTATAQDVEATLRLVYQYCEGIHPPPGMKTAMRDPTFCSLLIAIHSSGADLVRRFAQNGDILCLYYEIAVRYYPIFEDPQHTPLLSRLLEDLSVVHGLQHSDKRVRSRCCFLLLRLVMSLSQLLRPYVETAVSGIQQLLVQSQSRQNVLRVDDMMYLFETIGILVGKTGVSETQQHQYLTTLLTPHVRTMDEVLATPDLTRDVHHYGEILSCSIAAIAHLSKGFSKQPPAGVQSVLVETMRVTLRVLEALPSSEPVRNKTMVLVQRMIICIGDKVLPFIPQLLFHLIAHCTVDDILFVSQVFLQLCIKFKQQAVPAIDAGLMPFLHKCHSVIPQVETDVDSGLPPHLRTEQLSIQKLVFAVLQAIVVHNATAVLVSPTNASSLESILVTLKDGAVRVRDGVIQRTCIRFFRELMQQWGPEAAVDAFNGGGSSGDDVVYRRGFMTFTIQVFLVGMIQTVLDPTFNPQDANHSRCVTELSRVLWGCLKYDLEGTLTAVATLNGCEEFRMASSVEQLETTFRHLVKVQREMSGYI